MQAPIKRQGRFWVYIVQCRDGTYYTGYTNDLKERLRLHNAGNGAKYVRGKGPVEPVYVKEYRYYKRALQAEYRVKKLTRKQKKALVQDYERSSSQSTDGRGSGLLQPRRP